MKKIKPKRDRKRREREGVRVPMGEAELIEAMTLLRMAGQKKKKGKK